MDEVSARAEVADAVDDSRLAVSVPREEIERVLATEEDVDLVLDVVRTNGEREERRVFLAWDREALRRLVDQGGERIVVAIDPQSLQKALDADVEAHGLREVGATLAIAVTALGGAGTAGAAVAEGFQAGVTDFPSITATVHSGAPGAPGAFVAGATDFPSAAEEAGAPDAFVAGVTDFPSAAAEEAITADQPGGPGDLRPGQAVEAGMPRAMPSDYAAAGVDTGAPTLTEGERAALIQQHRARLAAEEPATPDIESIRAAQSQAPEADIESIRAAQPTPEATASGGGITVDVPSAGVTAALAGGAALTIAAAAFALRRRREPEPAT
jgi:hypothetical protein